MELHNRRTRGIGLICLCVAGGCGQIDAPPPVRNAPEEPPPQVLAEASRPKLVETHWPDGTLWVRKYVRHKADGSSVLEGLYTEWHPNGVKAYEVTFVGGKKHGIATRWHKNGQKWIEETYDHGMRHGPSTIWDATGTKRKEEHHFAGKPHGTWTTWNTDGRIKGRQEFDHNKPLP